MDAWSDWAREGTPDNVHELLQAMEARSRGDVKVEANSTNEALSVSAFMLKVVQTSESRKSC
jgi:hypothetical protein